MNRKLLFAFFFQLGILPLVAQKSYQVQSPDQSISVEVTVADKVTFAIVHDRSTVMDATVSMTLEGGEVLGANPKVSKVTKVSVDEEIASPLYKKDVVKDIYNEMRIAFKGNFGLTFRVYDSGVAYRFTTKRKGEVIITDEESTYNFPSDYHTFTAYVKSDSPTLEGQFFNSFENEYVYESLSRLNDKRLKFLPLMVDLEDGRKICITEADLEDYPGMYLNNESGKTVLKGVYAPCPKVTEQGGHNMLQKIVKEREDYIAKTSGTRSYPWRVFIISREDKYLANCDMVYRLASPSRLSDVSWIKPGKVAWDWWNDWNIYGVDFRAGINNETYKYYIDFASEHGVEYVILDEGWAVNLQADLMQVVPEIDVQELVDYGKSKNVGIILWAGYWAFARDMENVVKHYADMGVKGFKVDFMDSDNQETVQFLYEAAEVCAKYEMMVDFHGVFKPTGLNRTYPNVINYEAVHGLEQLKWQPETYDMVEYDVTIPFIRMIAGPMDYTQGAMRNAAKGNYYPVNNEPMSQGTRCHQLAEYVIFESPLNMMCDAPSNYMRERECTEFIAKVPTVWDETVSLDGKVAEYVALARRHGNDWYVGALTDWNARDMVLDLSFLGTGDYTLEVFKDGINADRAARDYKKEVIPVPADRKLKIHMAPGGGYAAHIYKR